MPPIATDSARAMAMPSLWAYAPMYAMHGFVRPIKHAHAVIHRLIMTIRT